MTQVMEAAIKAGTTEPTPFVLTDRRGDPIPLTLADSVQFRMRRANISGADIIGPIACSYSDAGEGEEGCGSGEIPWAAGQTDTPALYETEFKIAWADGTVRKVPNREFERLRIEESLG